MNARLRTFALAAAFSAFAATAATSTAAIAAPLENDPPAPEFTGITQWLNSEPLKLQQLRGKVVLVDFWTYSCINCANTLPYVKSWNQKYKDQGLTVIGVHTPEYPFERDTGNVKTAIKRLGISYPVAQDNQYATWNAYNNQYWPAFYLIDKKGQIVYSHFGEGDYAQTEAKIQALLAQKS
ncbi:thioredoxin family protein [Paraburkholderia sp. Ac-20342]|uniref:thioredoxin family protein n=1 Tax=unclassified Paraburkholderia TaxID=2615204 RepID=UPI0014238867|nr:MULTISPECIES: thioredoxin family protein [unclassified Paraburkholderia]MBN3847642.1 thioredoxin family protein [Paraburkholderia sp. Ac-20342]NIF78694.1 thioredoxin family protein [Paraburkholderia sp. Cy-641]